MKEEGLTVKGLVICFLMVFSAFFVYDGVVNLYDHLFNPYMSRAIFFLELLEEKADHGRSRPESAASPESWVALIKEAAKKGKFHLEKIGTSEEELQRLCRLCNQRYARFLVEKLRKYPDAQPVWIESCLTQLKKTGYEEVYLSKEELLTYESKVRLRYKNPF